MPTATTHPDLLAAAVLALAARDTDHATEQNGVGYNGTDTGFGNRLAATPVDRWTAGNRREAYEMLRKYRGQLAAYGIDYDEIPVPERAEGSKRTWRAGSYTLDFDGQLVMVAQYSVALVAEQKAIAGRYWDGAANRFPEASAAEVAALLVRHADLGWEITPAAQAVLDAAGEAPAETAAPAKVAVSMVGDRIALAFGYDPEMVAESRAIVGRRWDAAKKLNTFPLTPGSAMGIEAFLAHYEPVSYTAEALAALEGLAAAGREQAAAQEGLTDLSRAKDSEVEIDGLGGTLRPFQRAGVEYVTRAGGRSFIADDMGTGKTVQALAAVQAKQAFPAVVVCPASVKLSWRDHVNGSVPGAPDGWLPGRTVKVLKGRKPNGERAEGADVYVINWDILSGWVDELKAIAPRALILDESHYAKSGKAARTKAAKALAKAIPADGLVLNLTGTAVLNRPIELAAQLEIIGRLDDMGGFWNFAKRYCGAYRDKYGWRLDGASHLDELNAKLRATCFIRRMKSEIMAELPAKQIARVPVPLSNQAEYDRAEAETVRWLVEQVEADEAFAAEIADLPEDEQAARVAARKLEVGESARRAEHLVRLNALRRVAAEGKLAAAREWVADFLEGSDEKLIVFAHHVEIQRALLAEFPDAARVLGEDSAERRAEQVARFQDDPECRLIVCSLQAAGIGITLTAASDVAFIELGWTPALHDQAEDRAHRMGQQGNVTCWYLLADGTIDDDMHDLIEQKRAVVTATTDGTPAERAESIMGALEARMMARARA